MPVVSHKKKKNIYLEQIQLTQNSFRVLLRVIPENASHKHVSSITREKSCHRSIIKVGIGRLGLVHPDLGPLGHQVHVKRAIRGHCVEFFELGHVESVVVSGHIQVVTRQGRVGFDKVVRADDTLRIAYCIVRIAI